MYCSLGGTGFIPKLLVIHYTYCLTIILLSFDIHRYTHSVKEAEIETLKGAFITSSIMGVNFIIAISMFAVSIWYAQKQFLLSSPICIISA